MKVLFDSNLWISFMIGKRLSSLADVLCHHDIEVYISEQQLDEIVEAESNIRDPKDLYLLSMAESVPVDFIVSGDKDLTDLGSHAGIPILKYSDFLTRIP